MNRRLATLAIILALTLTLTACGQPYAATTAKPGAGQAAQATDQPVKTPVPAPGGPVAGTTVQAMVTTAPQAPEFASFSFLPGGTGWAVNARTVYTSDDSGRHWSHLADLAAPLHGIDFVSPQQGWVAGDTALFTTTDGGRTWAPVKLGVNGPVGRIDFVDARHGWVEAGNQLLRTTDGGKSWDPVSLAAAAFDSANPAGRFSFVSADAGWTLYPGQGGAGQGPKTLYRTVDGGRHWKLIAKTDWPPSGQAGIGGGAGALGAPGVLPSSGYASDLFFLDADHGWLTENRGGMLATTDGGRTWETVPVAPGGGEEFLGEVQFASPSEGYVSFSQGGTALILATEDGGKSWTQRYPTRAPAGFDANTTQFLNPLQGVAAGTPTDGGAILVTSDGGRSWTQVFSFGQDGGVIALDFVDPDHGWAVTERWFEDGAIKRSLYRTTDGGRSWSAVASRTDSKELFASLSFVSQQTGYVASGWGHLSLTQDGGVVFQSIDKNDSHSFGFRFLDPNQGWKVNDGQIYATTDGGNTWTPVPLGYRVVQVDPVALPTTLKSTGSPAGQALDRLWVVTADASAAQPPALLSSSDGGKSWTRYDLGGLKPTAAWFVAEDDGWLTDDAGHLYKTSDGGQSWTQVH